MGSSVRVLSSIFRRLRRRSVSLSMPNRGRLTKRFNLWATILRNWPSLLKISHILLRCLRLAEWTKFQCYFFSYLSIYYPRIYMMEWKYNHKRLTIAYFPTSFPLLKSCYFSMLSINWYLFFLGRIHKRSFRLGYFWSILQIIRRILKNVPPKIISLPSSPHTQKHRHCEEAWIMSAWQ